MNVKKLSMDQLLQNLNESQSLIQLFHNLIRSHRKIIKSLKTVNQDGSREIHIQNNKNFIDDFKESISCHQENIEKISSEITRRNSTISSPHEVSDYFSSISNFLESIFSFQFFELLGYFTPIFFILIFYLFFTKSSKILTL